MRLRWPIDNISKYPPIFPTGDDIYFSQAFGVNPQVYQQFGMTGHDGIDIACPKGTPVKASHDGWVIESVAKDTGYGIRVQVYFEEDGFGYSVINGHFMESKFPEIPYNLKERRYKVKEGQVLGLADSTGFSTGNHDHFSYRQFKDYKILNYNNGTFGWMNPLPYMKDPHVLETVPMKLYKDNRTDPATIVVGNAVDAEANLKWICSQNGKTLPLRADGSVDFAAIVYDGEIS